MRQPNPERIVSDPEQDENTIAAWIDCMMPAIRAGAAAVVCPGLEFDDAVQEGLIGLLRAVGTWQPGGASFSVYARVCIQNAQLDARRAALRKKNLPLNTRVDLNENAFDTARGPDEQLIWREEVRTALDRMSTRLSAREREVMTLYLDGKSCKQIARFLQITPKSAENALSRARKKLKGN